MAHPSSPLTASQKAGAIIEENYQRWLDNTRKWAEILTFDPDPQTGITPKDVVWRKNKAKLYRYISPNGVKHRTPILMLYALINEAYILDLAPGMSLVEYLVDNGYDVYLLEWGDFQWEDRGLTLADFIFDYIANAARKVCQFSKTDQLSIIGYCMGGTMASMYASLFDMPRVKNMVYLAAPFDFSSAGVAGVWINNEAYDFDKIVDTLKLIPSYFIDSGVKLLNPVGNYLGTYTRLWKLLDEGAPVQPWKVLNKWVNDNKNFPGEAFRQWIHDCYQGNKLVKKELLLRGRRVDLSNIRASVLLLAGEKDHLVLPEQTMAAMRYIQSEDISYKEYPIGHGGLVFGGIAKKQVYPYIVEWLRTRS
ncbi:MAG: alpha/beta fold hydrolase [Syntrophomonadaceae bacterium]|jgi:polyhydroxyalkanoate synthase